MTWLTWQRVPVGGMRIDAPRREAALSLAYALAYVGLAWLTGRIILSHPVPILGAASFTDDAWYVFFFKVGALLLVPAGALLAHGYRTADFLPGWHLRPSSVVGLMLALALGLSLNLGQLGPDLHALALLPADRTAVRLTAAVLLPLFAAALPEELFFRGVLQTRLEATVGRPGGLLAATALFVAWHLPTRYLLAEGVEGHHGNLASVLIGTAIPVLVVGLIFAWLWDRYRSLPALIAAHWAVDFLPTLTSLVGIHR